MKNVKNFDEFINEGKLANISVGILSLISSIYTNVKASDKISKQDIENVEYAKNDTTDKLKEIIKDDEISKDTILVKLLNRVIDNPSKQNVSSAIEYMISNYSNDKNINNDKVTPTFFRNMTLLLDKNGKLKTDKESLNIMNAEISKRNQYVSKNTIIITLISLFVFGLILWGISYYQDKQLNKW